MPSENCPNVARCPLYKHFSLETSLRTLQILYCHGEYSTCERYKRASSGERVPERMLPNGQQLPTNPRQ